MKNGRLEGQVSYVLFEGEKNDSHKFYGTQFL